MNIDRLIIDEFEAAVQGDDLRVVFELPVSSDKTVTATLSAFDQFDMLRIQDEIYLSELQYYEGKGKNKLPIVAGEWETNVQDRVINYREQLKDDPELETKVAKFEQDVRKKPPRNLAEQLAQRSTRVETTKKILPKFLRWENDELMFPDEKDQERFEKIIGVNPRVNSALMKAYVRLMNMMSAASEQVKNE